MFPAGPGAHRARAARVVRLAGQPGQGHRQHGRHRPPGARPARLCPRLHLPCASSPCFFFLLRSCACACPCTRACAGGKEGTPLARGCMSLQRPVVPAPLPAPCSPPYPLPLAWPLLIPLPLPCPWAAVIVSTLMVLEGKGPEVPATLKRNLPDMVRPLGPLGKLCLLRCVCCGAAGLREACAAPCRAARAGPECLNPSSPGPPPPHPSPSDQVQLAAVGALPVHQLPLCAAAAAGARRGWAAACVGPAAAAGLRCGWVAGQPPMLSATGALPAGPPLLPAGAHVQLRGAGLEHLHELQEPPLTTDEPPAAAGCLRPALPAANHALPCNERHKQALQSPPFPPAAAAS